MNNRPTRSRAGTENRTTAPEPTRSERLRVALTGAAAAGALSMLLIGATTAMGGSGGVESGGDGSRTSDGGNRYTRMWDSFSKKDKNWAHSTSNCESGGDPNIHGGGGTYHGAFQFMKSTWKSSPKSPGGDPHTYAWKTQAVVAVKLKHRDGARTHWPNCG